MRLVVPDAADGNASAEPTCDKWSARAHNSRVSARC